MPVAEIGQATGAAERLHAQNPLWPWVSRFLWSPAQDLHPSRRAELLPGWDDEAWSHPGVLRHVSRHLLASAGLTQETRWEEDAQGSRLALLPQEALALLARRVGLALRPPRGEALASLAQQDRAFVTEPAPLYWHADEAQPPAGFEASGWRALRTSLQSLPNPLRRRFEWKTPIHTDPAQEESGASHTAEPLQALALRIVREFQEPWSCLFTTPLR